MDTPTHIVLSQLILELVENLLEKCPPVIKHVSQAETIFNSLMTVGLERQGDLKTSLSTNLTDKLRDALNAAVADPNVDDDVSKILLQLVELQASEWQLSREALVYYYFK